MKKIAVILSGCGYLDGAEIRESVLTLLYLDQACAEVQIFAPDINQHHVVDHLSGEEVSETRNVLIEAARIARGQVKPLAQLNAEDYDALIVPGGYGVAKNLSDLAFKGPDAEVLPEFKVALDAFKAVEKPIGLICISPAVGACALDAIKVTIGDDEGTAAAIQAMGGTHEDKPTEEICIDDNNKIVSCSAYMREDKLSKVGEGIEKLVKKVLELA